jgi:Protein of unknown function (DUF3363)
MGRVHQVRLTDLDAVGDVALGGIVELRRSEDAASGQRTALAVRPDFRLEAQVQAQGATWLDRQLVGRSPAMLASGGFGAGVGSAIERRVEHLVGQGLARRHGQRVTFARDLLETLTALRSCLRRGSR